MSQKSLIEFLKEEPEETKLDQPNELAAEAIQLSKDNPISIVEAAGIVMSKHAEKDAARQTEYDTGKTDKEIAEAVGSPVPTIVAWRRRNDLKPNKKDTAAPATSPDENTPTKPNKSKQPKEPAEIDTCPVFDGEIAASDCVGRPDVYIDAAIFTVKTIMKEGKKIEVETFEGYRIAHARRWLPKLGLLEVYVPSINKKARLRKQDVNYVLEGEEAGDRWKKKILWR